MPRTADDFWPFSPMRLASRPLFPSQALRGFKMGGRFVSLASIITLLKLVLTMRGRLGTLILASLVNAVMFFVLVAGWITVREGSPRSAYEVLFEPSASAAVRERETRIALLQAQLRAEASNIVLIRQNLDGFLSRWPGVARVRLAVIHNGTVGVGDSHLWKYDVIAAVAANGRAPGPLTQNDSLEGWAHFLPELLAGRCAVYPTGSIPRTAGRDRLEALGVQQVLTCPVATPNGEVLGALFVLFDRTEDLPRADVLDQLKQDGRGTGQGLSYALIARRAS